MDKSVQTSYKEVLTDFIVLYWLHCIITFLVVVLPKYEVKVDVADYFIPSDGDLLVSVSAK